MFSIKYIDIIEFSVSSILQNRINSPIVNNKDTKDLTYFLTKIHTDRESLMNFVGISIIDNHFKSVKTNDAATNTDATGNDAMNSNG